MKNEFKIGERNLPILISEQSYSNCIQGKHTSLNVGSNDILKRRLPMFQYNRTPVQLHWDNT